MKQKKPFYSSSDGIQRKSNFLSYKQFILTCFFALSFLIVFTISVSAQPTEHTAKYNIRVLGMNIGVFTVTQNTSGNDVKIKAITDVEVKLLFTYRVKYVQNSFYQNGILQSCHVQAIKNGEIHSDMRLEKQGETYLLTEDGTTKKIDGNITYSGSLLYFNEPKNISVMFNERTGVKKRMKCEAGHLYALTDEKGNKTNEYEYKDGVLSRAKLIHTLATVHLERSM